MEWYRDSCPTNSSWFAFGDSVVRMSLQLSEKHFEEEPCEFEDAA